MDRSVLQQSHRDSGVKTVLEEVSKASVKVAAVAPVTGDSHLDESSISEDERRDRWEWRGGGSITRV